MSSWRHRILPSTIVLALAAALLAGSPAQADTAAELAKAIDEVADLESKAEAASQRVRRAEAAHDKASKRLSELTKQVADQRVAVQESEQSVGRVARASYTAGGIDPALYLLLADNGEDFAAAAQDLQRVSAGVASDLARHLDREHELRRLLAEIAAEEARTAAAQARADAAAEDVRSLLAAAQAREAALERKYAEELAEQRRREEAAAAAAAEAARAAHAAAAAAASTPARAPASTAPARPAKPAAPAPPAPAPGTLSGSQRQQIVAYALAQVGGRYVFGADGPYAFDCSSLVGSAYAAAGVPLVSYTRAQAARARAIPLSAAQPGDLLFYFGLGADHVAIYLGDGRMVHAVNPRRGITVDSVYNSWYMQRFSMAGRIL